MSRRSDILADGLNLQVEIRCRLHQDNNVATGMKVKTCSARLYVVFSIGLVGGFLVIKRSFQCTLLETLLQ